MLFAIFIRLIEKFTSLTVDFYFFIAFIIALFVLRVVYLAIFPKALERDLKEGCDRGKKRDCFDLGRMKYKNGNLKEARVYFKKACELGHKEGCLMMGYIEGINNRWWVGNIDKAKVYYKKACDLGDKWGCYNLGLLEDNAGNIKEARVYFKKACDLGHEEGCSVFEKLKGE